MIYQMPTRQAPFDLSTTHYAMLARIDGAGADVHAQVSYLDRFGAQADLQPFPTLAIVPVAQEASVAAALAANAGKLAPGAGEGSIGDVFKRYEGFAIALPLDRRVISVRVPNAAVVFVFDATAAPSFVNGLVWTCDIARSCGCKG